MPKDVAETDRERVAATCKRLADTPRNLLVPLTDAERDDLRLAALLLKADRRRRVNQ